MSDWQVGDLALCVDDRPNPTYGRKYVVAGGVYRVAAIARTGPCKLYGRCIGLILDDVADSAPEGVAAPRFRKIEPDKHEACEEEFVTLLERTKVSA